MRLAANNEDFVTCTHTSICDSDCSWKGDSVDYDQGTETDLQIEVQCGVKARLARTPPTDNSIRLEVRASSGFLRAEAPHAEGSPSAWRSSSEPS